VAVLGDIESAQERLYHRQSGEYAASAGVKLVWGVGPLSESTAEGFRAASEMGDGVAVAGHVPSPAETSPVAASLRTGDVVLFKASRSVRLESMAAGIAEQARAGRWAGEAREAGAGDNRREIGTD
jgi:UDP-N-acetylmuramyl pentapeptide synthase